MSLTVILQRNILNYKTIAEIEIKGKRIVVKDSMIMLDDDEISPEWPCLNVESGTYTIEVNMYNEDICSSVIVKKVGKTFSSKTEIGSVDVDHGSIGIIDYDNFLTAVQNNYDEYEEWTSGPLDDVAWEKFFGKIDFKNEPLYFLHSGEGDGTYPIYELIENNKVIGFECEFIPKDA